MGRAALHLAIVLAACSGEAARGVRAAPASAGDSGDSAFAQVQARGHQAMGVDQYTSTHRFESLSDGGRISLQRNSTDQAGAARIRRHMQTIATAFAQGHFQLPGFVHGREVPGTEGMTRLRSRITYTVESLPSGGQLRIRSSDPTAVTAIHQFLSFQRQDHRSEAGAADH